MRSKKSVTLQDIAQALKISVSAVSLAISNRPGISAELRAQIMAKAQEMGYRKSKYDTQHSTESNEEHMLSDNSSKLSSEHAHDIAEGNRPEQSIKTRASHDIRIDVLIDSIFIQDLSSFYMEIFRQLSQYSLANNISIFLQVLDHHDHLRNELILRNLHNVQSHGMIVIGQIQNQDLSLLKSNVQCPIVFIDYYLESERHFNFVLIDSFSGMHRLVKNLISEYHYKDLCFVGTITQTTSILDRYLGYVKALKEFGLEDSVKRILPDRDQNGQIKVVLPDDESFKMPQLFVCNCDKTAAALIAQLNKRGIHVPIDVGVCGFDNFIDQNDEALLQSLGLTIHTFDHSTKQLAYSALETLMHQITSSYAPHLCYIEGKIMPGNSVQIQPQ